MRSLVKKVVFRAASALLPRERSPRPTPVEIAYARRPDELFAYLHANGISTGRDALARAATRGRRGYDGLVAVLRHGRPAWAVRSVLRSVDREVYLQLAILLADQQLNEPREGALLLRSMADHLGPQAIRKAGRFRLIESMLEAGDVRDLPALLEAHTIGRENSAQPFLFAANARNRFRGASRTAAADIRPWVSALNEMYAADGLEGIDIAAGDAAPFDRVRASADAHVGGPLVTVIIPTYDPGDRLATAVESLLAQSHQNLQILIMDDASPAESAALLDSWADRDPRIEIVHLPENNGPYFARNVAASQHARGTYVTIHDDDDWSHPRKIELQVAHLVSAPETVANMSNSVRASDDLWLGRINGNPVWTQQGLNTLMVRREVFDAIGYWDVLNRSADAEFNDRIRAWTQQRIPTIGSVPLTLYRIRWDSLSAGEFNRGYMDPRRRWYFQSYLHWHETCAAHGEIPHLPADDRGSRPFSVPRDLSGSRAAHAAQPLDVDIVIAGDFRVPAADHIADEVADLLTRGSRVALLQLDSPATAPAARLRPRVLEVAPLTEVIGPMDRVTAGVAVVTDPSSLQFVHTDRSAVSAARVVIIDRADHDIRRDERLHDSDVAAAAAQALFGSAADFGPAVSLASFL